MQDDETCRYNPKTIGATSIGYVDLPSRNEHKLKEAVATVGPISVAIDASQDSFQNYDSGKFNTHIETNVNNTYIYWLLNLFNLDFCVGLSLYNQLFFKSELLRYITTRRKDMQEVVQKYIHTSFTFAEDNFLNFKMEKIYFKFIYLDVTEYNELVCICTYIHT